jgi:hypothetical protein
MPTVYLETTLPSYLAAWPSRDLIVTAHQQITQEWWQDARSRFEIFISEEVLREIRAGDADAVARRLAVVQGLPILSLTAEVRRLVRWYERRLGLPDKAFADLAHIAFAVAYRMDYLVTWNCAHIANGEVIRRLVSLNTNRKRHTPLIVTPEELLLPGKEKAHES